MGGVVWSIVLNSHIQSTVQILGKWTVLRCIAQKYVG